MVNTHHPRDWNPYLAGIVLGLLLLATYAIMGFGLGSSAAATRLAVAGAHVLAPETIESNAYFARYFTSEQGPLADWMIFEALGVFLGGIVAAYSAGRMRAFHIDKGVLTNKWTRLALAIAGGILMGFAARIARGCTSGQALTGGAVLSVGSWVFMLSVFAGGYLGAPLVRKWWK